MKHFRKLEGKDMFGIFDRKLDKNTCIASLIMISLVTMVIAMTNTFNVFNISGVFKQ